MKTSYFSLPVILVQVVCFQSVQRIGFANCAASFRCFLDKSNLVFLMMSVTSGLHLVVVPLYFLLWRCLGWLDIVKLLFWSMDIILPFCLLKGCTSVTSLWVHLNPLWWCTKASIQIRETVIMSNKLWTKLTIVSYIFIADRWSLVDIPGSDWVVHPICMLSDY